MKHLWTGVAMVAALATAAPVWAQTSTAPMTPPASPSAAAPAEGAAGQPTSTRKYLHHVVHHPSASLSGAAPVEAAAGQPMSSRRYLHRVVHHQQGMSGARQLNAQELQRIQAGAPPPPMTPYPR